MSISAQCPSGATMLIPHFYRHFVSYWEKLDRRPLGAVRHVVIHCTELPSLEESRLYAEKILYPSGTGACGHFYIDRDGTVIQFVPLGRMAHHVASFNRRTVGIELVNQGRYPHWYGSDHQEMTQPYTEAQYDALIRLLTWLAMGPLGPGLVLVGHEDLDTRLVAAAEGKGVVRRKVDPGPMFEWERVSGFSSWKIRRQGRALAFPNQKR